MQFIQLCYDVLRIVNIILMEESHDKEKVKFLYLKDCQ